MFTLEKGSQSCTLTVRIFPANTIHSPIVGSMLGQRRRRWPSIEPALSECLVFAGLLYNLDNLSLTRMFTLEAVWHGAYVTIINSANMVFLLWRRFDDSVHGRSIRFIKGNQFE